MKKAKGKMNSASSGESMDTSMDIMEETRYRKKNQRLALKISEKMHFSFKEAECLLIIYYKLQKISKENAQGIDKTQFRDILHCSLDMTDDYLMDRIFYTLDKGPSSYISKELWATNLSLFLRGTIEEKINYCFSVYDAIGDGILARENMFQLMKNSFVSDDEEAEEAAKDLVEVITKKMDLDRDGKISLNDYKLSILKQPMLLEVFGQCLPTRRYVTTFLTTFIPKISKM